ncbi:MAG: MmgE/PrpD family protein [Pseudomonadota bacterium]
MTTALTVGLGKFVAGLRYKDIPKEAISFIHTGFTDCVGVMLAGASEPPAQLLRSTLAPSGGESTLLFGEGRASAPDAAWINGAAAHALDFDDVGQRGHPSTVLVPAILAEAEAIGASGEAMVLAYAAGYETWAELVRRESDSHHMKGWHPTGIFGAIGAAAACASLRGLDAEKAAQAIALGASQSAGVMSNFGTMTKPFHAGKSAHAGVIAARLAEKGFTAALDALEHPQGFLGAVSPAGKIDLESPIQAGSDWKLARDGVSVKKYPLCYCTHRALDGMLDLLQANPVDAAKVSRVTVSTSKRFIITLRNHAPQTGLEAKFSMEFAMACALIAKRASLVELTDSFVRRPDVQALMKRVALKEEKREDASGAAIYEEVTLETNDAHTYSKQVTQVRGGSDLPLSREELWAKFEGCAQVGTARVSAKALFDALMSLDRLPNVRNLPGIAAVSAAKAA